MALSIPGWSVLGRRGLPSILEAYKQRAALIEHFGQAADDSDVFFAAVGRTNDWPRLVVTQHFSPCHGGFDPGIALVPTTRTVFIGAGTRLVAYRLNDPPIRLWEDRTDVGFWGWSVYDQAVVMSAELELAAWDPSGTKLWSRSVEPPWGYTVLDGRVHLDVMGEADDFDILEGP